MYRVSLYFVFAFFCLCASAQELYKYTDENGVEQIVDSPYKLPENIREKYIKEYEKKKKMPLPPDLQNTRPAYKDAVKNPPGDEAAKKQSEKDAKKAALEKQKRIEELTREMEETVKELGYKTQRALITQIPELKSEVEKLKEKVEEIKKEIEKLSNDNKNETKREE